MPEYSSTTITPADSVKVPAMNGGSSGNFQLDALRNFILASKGQANGLASLGADGKLTAAQLPDLADDVIVVDSYATLPNPGIAGKIYITRSNPTNAMYRWDDTLSTPDYVVLSVDLSAYATKAEMEAADTDLKNALSATNARVENLEQEHGSYNEVTAKSPYTIPSGKAKNWAVNVLRGVTRARNQLVKSDAFSGGYSWSSYGVTYSASDNIGTLVGTGTSGASIYTYSGQTIIAGHKYLVAMSGKANATMNYGFNVGGVGMASAFTATTSWSSSAEVITATTASTNAIFYIYNTTSNTLQVKDFFIRDLTLYFGGTIPSDADTISKIQANYPELLVPSAYGNSLLSTRYEGVKAVFKNLAQINSFTQSTSYGQTVPCNLRKGVTYTVSGTASGGSTMRLLKSDGSYQYVAITATINTTFVAEDDISEASFYGILSVSNLQIEQGSSKTTFSEYHAPSTLSLPTPITLRSAGTVAEEAYLNEDGEAWKTNPLIDVDLTDVTWTYDSSYPNFYASQDSRYKVHGGISCSVYVPSNGEYGDMGDMSISITSAGGTRIRFKDSSHTGSQLVGGKAPWLSGVHIYVELATASDPTQLDPVENPYLATESGGTISSILTDAVDDSMTLGYINL